MNRTKIICSIGPASTDAKVLDQMIEKGMNVGRFNMSHGTYESHTSMIDAVKAARERAGKAVSILIDTKGPEIRIGRFENSKIFLKEGDKFTISTEDIAGTQEAVSVTYKNLPKVLSKGSKILLDDGKLEFKAIELTDTTVVCEVVQGGALSNNKSINIPGVATDMEYLSEKDKNDLKFAKEMKADYLAISFVNCKEDVMAVRNLLDEIKFDTVKIISKIESEEGVKNFDEILELSDGIMVARGDLGVEIDFVKIPILQKQFIEKTTLQGKIVVTATQMLETMTSNPRPTRAEISDVANAVFDGTTAIMLSGETASGDHPVTTVHTMRRIASEAENHTFGNPAEYVCEDISTNIGYAVAAISETENISAIIALTESGKTAADISRFRPEIPVVACTPNSETFHKMALLYGVIPCMIISAKSLDELHTLAIDAAKANGLVNTGDTVVLVSSEDLAKSGSSNTLIVRKV